MSEQPRPWGPFGMGPWKGHPKVYCCVCGWPRYHMWVDREHEPSGDCPNGHTLARSCPLVLDTLMLNAWGREALGGREPQAPIEMLRKVTGLSWAEIETITEMRAKRGVA